MTFTYLDDKDSRCLQSCFVIVVTRLSTARKSPIPTHLTRSVTMAAPSWNTTFGASYIICMFMLQINIILRFKL